MPLLFNAAAQQHIALLRASRITRSLGTALLSLCRLRYTAPALACYASLTICSLATYNAPALCHSGARAGET